MTIILSFRDDDHMVEPKIYPGRAEGLQLVLDAHTDKVSLGSVSDNLSLTLNGRNSETKNDKNNPKVPFFQYVQLLRNISFLLK